ncbi:hypothetical protein MHBO_000727 [Bonamia ostreae]|uniref:TRUD domain-containing protein n=1 Tax=Bonamia ostreae TaxID=126728 RepID=A0ABV2AGQ5_9EUKA
MRLRPKLFSFCGNKDRKAVTIQRVCAKRITAKRVRDVSRFSRRLFVGDFEYQVRPLSLGQLDGNRFNIVLRKIEKKRKNDFEAISESIKENGFINYFGLQRFGSCSVPTHNFGKLVLKRQWDELVALILFTDEIGKLPTQHRKIAETLKNKKSFSEALKHCPKHLSVERPVLERLSQNINSRDAFNSIARQTKSIYVHAFQSYIWNKAASARLKKYGFSPVVGDLVVLGKEQGMAQSSGRKTKTLVRSLGKADVDSGDFSIFDVVLPLPCAGCELPRNEAGEIYEAELKKEGISDQLVEKLRKDRSLIIYPNYRPLMMRCLNFKSKFGSGLENSLPVEQPELIENGSFSEMVNEQLVDRTLGEEQSSKTVDCEKKSGIIIDREKFCAAQLQFDLPSSCYATSLLREFSK